MSNVVKRTTRFPGGLNTSTPTQAMAGLGMLDPSVYHFYFNDFDTYAAGDWTVTAVGAGTQALTALDGGNLLLTNAAADDNSIFMQLKAASFTPAAGKKSFFKCRLKVSDATQSDVQVGLILTDTTPLDATDGIYFQKDDGDAQIDIYVRKDATTGSNSATNVGTLVDDTFIELGWAYTGGTVVYFFINDAMVYRLDGSSTYLPDALLNVSLGIQNGEAVAKTMTVDYVFAACER